MSGRIRVTEVLDTRERRAKPGQQQQTIDAAEKAQPSIDGCSCVVLLSFIPDAEGAFTVEVGVGGSGPVGFSKVVAETMRAVADVVGGAMARQEQQRWRSS